MPIVNTAKFVVPITCFVAFSGMILIKLGLIPVTRSIGVQANFIGPVEIDADKWMVKEARVTCNIRSVKQLHLLGVQVPCPCIKTDELPTQIHADEDREINFVVDLSGFLGAKAGKPIEMQVGFFAVNREEKILAQLTLIPRIDLVGGDLNDLNSK